MIIRLVIKIIFCLVLFYFLLIALACVFWSSKRKTIRELLYQTIDVLNNGGIQYWVDFGTLLGIHRDKDIILGDNDADICIPITEEDKVKQLFKDHHSLDWQRLDWPAFRTYKKFGCNKIEVFIDLYLVTIDIDKQVVDIPADGETPLKYLSEFESVTMPVGSKSLTFTQPRDWESLLVYRYGKKWVVKTNKWYIGYLSFVNAKKPIN